MSFASRFVRRTYIVPPRLALGQAIAGTQQAGRCSDHEPVSAVTTAQPQVSQASNTITTQPCGLRRTAVSAAGCVMHAPGESSNLLNLFPWRVAIVTMFAAEAYLLYAQLMLGLDLVQPTMFALPVVALVALRLLAPQRPYVRAHGTQGDPAAGRDFPGKQSADASLPASCPDSFPAAELTDTRGRFTKPQSARR